jgi:hypothetical protein
VTRRIGYGSKKFNPNLIESGSNRNHLHPLDSVQEQNAGFIINFKLASRLVLVWAPSQMISGIKSINPSNEFGIEF